MYAVVGCSECAALWVVEGRPGTTECPRCGSRRAHARRKKFLTTGDADEAREARARLLAERQGQDDAFATVESFAALDDQLDHAGIDDETYLEGSGLDADAIAEAGERATSTGPGLSRTETVRTALRRLEEPSADDVREFCEQHGVSGEFAAEALEKLGRAGEVSEQDGTYRLL